jgi:hypothetical protein
VNNTRIENTEFKKLIGKWKTEGKILVTENSPEIKITGTDTYELVLGGHFILHKADVQMGNEKSQTFEIIGLVDPNGQAIFEHYNNQGSSGKMYGTLINNALRINGEFLRFKGSVNDSENQIDGRWEKWDDQNGWKYFLEIKLIKCKME